MFDLILENATVVDGTGGQPYQADVGIGKGLIEALGDLEGSEAARRIDAGGRTVCPGFIDVHSHADLTMFREDAAELLRPLVRQGITTFVGGNCGMALAPVSDENREGLKTYLEIFTQMDFDTAIRWKSMGEFMERVEEKSLLLNMALLVPHGMLRISALGLEDRPADAGAMGMMRRQLEESMQAGAFGLSTGLQYFPGLFSDTEELVKLSEPLSRYGGIFTSHLRSYTSTTLGRAIDEVGEVSRANGIRGQVSHIFSIPWTGPVHPLALRALKWMCRHPETTLKLAPHFALDASMNVVLKRLEKNREAGADIAMDIMPTTAGFTHLLAFFPPWVLTGDRRKVVERISDPGTRREILRDIEKGRPAWPHSGRNDWSLNIMRQMGWDAVTVMAVHSEKNRHLEGRLFTDIAEERGMHPFDVMCDLLIEEEGQVLVFESMSEPDDAFTERYTFPALQDPGTMITTDTLLMGVGKPSYLFYGCYPKFFGRYVNDMKLLDLPEAVRRCTSLPADFFGIKGRGLVREGYRADLLVMDAEGFRTEAVFREPERFPTGLDTVIINGVPVVEGGEVVPGRLAGSMLRKNER
ncbi:MAG: amidohydrolase family protein [Actinomycetota bacterium]|nr:amidohydrolase family protein [Actinomycetota bacterium]